MKIAIAAAWLAAFTLCSAQDGSWTAQPGRALHLSGNAKGDLWVIGVDRVSASGYSVHKFVGSQWQRIAGAGRRLAVDPKGDVWMVDDNHAILRYTEERKSWEVMPGLAVDIAAGGDGSVWVLGIGESPGGYQIFQWTGSNWRLVPGGAVRIAVDREGVPWVVNNQDSIYRFNTQRQQFELKPGKARGVFAGAKSGAIWVTGISPMAGGLQMWQWDAQSQAWNAMGTVGAQGITEKNGVMWIFQSDGAILSKVSLDPIIISTTTISGLELPDVWMGPMAPPPVRVSSNPAKGELLCAARDGGAAVACGETKADYVGAYQLDLTCDEGFYDPIYGGTCWKCPDDEDGRGTWIRSADAVDKDTACWRAPSEKLGPAIKVRSPGWAWECPGGSFWDGYSPDGPGGSCWKCPDDLPRRTAHHIGSGSACASPVNETRRAKLLKFNGCPTPNAISMNLPGKRQPGKPFLDIAAGWSQGVASGGCYACPVVDEEGNFLITARNANPIYDRDNNTGCRINLKWKPGGFELPGMSGLAGFKEFLWENRVFEGERLTSALHDQASAKGLEIDSPEARIWVAERWKEVAAGPYRSEAFRLYVFTLLRKALEKDPEKRTDVEKRLIASFENFIRNYRVYLAEQALAMYDSWKVASEDARSQLRTSSLENLFYYGTVPLDFHATLQTLAGVGGAGAAVLGSMVAAQGFANFTQFGFIEQLNAYAPLREYTLFHLTKGLNIFKSLQGLSAVSGATLIQAAAAVITSIAMDQFVEIQSARSRLESSVATAAQPVNLDELLAGDNGEDMLYQYWAKAMEGREVEDPQVVKLVRDAQAVSQQNAYAFPSQRPSTVRYAIFRHTKQGAQEALADFSIAYQNAGGARWTTVVTNGMFTLVGASGTESQKSQQIEVTGWDGVTRTVKLLPDGKTFRLTGPGSATSDTTTLQYVSWTGDRWSATVEKASPAP